jgi:RNA-directed DNA polymerase
VKKNRGSAGLDDVTMADCETRKGYDLDLLPRQRRDGTYRPQPVKRVAIPKPDGGVRKLGMPTVLDRVCQQALGQRREPLFEPQWSDWAFGYRPGRAPHRAMRKVWQELQADTVWSVAAELRQDFDTIAQDKLMDLMAEESSDGRGLQLVRHSLRAGACDEGYWQPTLTGGPQGGGASPVWSNIFLTPFARKMTMAGLCLTRWADDCVVRCRTRAEAQRALATAERLLQEELGVRLHPQKTRMVHISQGFAFLGYKGKQGTGQRLPAAKRRGRSHPHNRYAVPREKSSTRLRDQIRKLTRRQAPLTLQEMIDRINPVMRGGGTFYRKADVRRLFQRLDGWIVQRLYACRAKRWRNTLWRRYPTSRRITAFGFVRLTHRMPGLMQR